MPQTSPRPPGRAEQDQKQPDDRPEYTLSEAPETIYPLSEALQKLASIAPSLKEAELRVLTHLTSQAIATRSVSVRASSREIATATKASRANVKAALHSMGSRSIIATRTGGGAKTSTHLLTYLRTHQMGGIAASPPPQLPGLENTLEWDRSEPTGGIGMSPGGIGTSPPPTENKGLAAAEISLDNYSDSIELLDRVLLASPKGKNRDELQHTAYILDHFARKLRREYDRPPDSTVCAQVLEACGNRRDVLQNLLIGVHNSQVAGHAIQAGVSPAWWVTVALQRLHGIEYKTTAARREELKAARRPKLERLTARENPDEDLKRAIATATAAMSPEWMKRK